MRKNAVLWTIVVIAVLVRVPAVLGDGLWRDEAYVYVDLIAPGFAEFLHRVTETEWHPPLFFFLDYAWTRVAGTSELALNLLPAACSIATVPIVYLLGRDADSRLAGIYSAAIFAVAPMAVSFSDEYVYPFAGLTFALLAWRIVRARLEPMTAARFLALAGATSACVYSHYTAFFVIPMLTLWALVAHADVRRKLAILGAVAAGLVTFLPWLPVFLYQRHIGLPYEAATSFAGKAAFYVAALMEYVPIRPLDLQLAAAVLLVAAIVVVMRAKRMKPDAAALGAIFLSTLAMTTAGDLLAARYALPSYAFLCVFFGSTVAALVALIEIPKQWQQLAWLASLALVVVAAASDATYAIADAATPKSGIRSLATARAFDGSTLYVIAPDYMTPTFYFYARGSPVSFRGFVRNDRPEVFRLDDYVTIWNRPDAVGAAVAAIERDAPHFACIDLVIDSFARDQAQLPYGKVWELVRRLARRYPLVAHAAYPARDEPVDVYALATGAPGSGAAAANCR